MINCQVGEQSIIVAWCFGTRY